MSIKSLFKLLKKSRNLFFLRNVLIYKLISVLYRKNIGTSIFEEDWDNMIILDGCRFDIFKLFYNKKNLNGILRKKKSRGAHTVSFLQENFDKIKNDDLIYITANPYVDIHLQNKIFKIISVWKDGWDSTNKTVLPESMYNQTIKILKKYPNFKYIIHFMQPHYPYIGYDIRDGSIERLRKAVIEKKEISLKQEVKTSFFSLYSSKIYSLIEPSHQIRLYVNNLNLVIPFVQKLINILPGKTIVTSDHGEAFGERIHPLIPFKFYGHQKGLNMDVLITIPWLVIPQEQKDKHFQQDFNEKSKIKKELKHLKERGITF
ncbi:MAG: hypothetical protein ACFE8L_10050 [Candidatus Hodarchaeota archaeon]